MNVQNVVARMLYLKRDATIVSNVFGPVAQLINNNWLKRNQIKNVPITEYPQNIAGYVILKWISKMIGFVPFSAIDVLG